MNFTKEQKERFDKAETVEEKKKIISELGLELTEEELSAVAGGFLPHESKLCGTLPGIWCTGLFYGIDACAYYVEENDPNAMPTAYTYPVLCTCTHGHFKNVPMMKEYQK